TGVAVVQALGLIDQDLYFRVGDCVAARDVPQILELIESLFMQGTSTEEFLSGLLEHLRNLLVVSDTGSPDVLELSETDKKRVAEASKRFKAEDLLRLIRITTEASNSLKQGMHPRFVLELALVRMTKLDKTVTVDELLSSLSRMRQSSTAEVPIQAEKGQKEAPLPIAPSVTAPPVESANEPANPSVPLSLEEIQDRWGEFIREVKLGRVTAGTFLQEGIPVSIEGNTLTIGFRLCNGFHIDAILRAETVIKQALKKVYGKELHFCCVKGEFAQLEKNRPPSKEERLQQLKETNPTIDLLSKELGAELV
ncbi:MAG TPA: hypothetical protein VGB38_08725, partial [bacterium]